MFRSSAFRFAPPRGALKKIPQPIKFVTGKSKSGSTKGVDGVSVFFVHQQPSVSNTTTTKQLKTTTKEQGKTKAAFVDEDHFTEVIQPRLSAIGQEGLFSGKLGQTAMLSTGSGGDDKRLYVGLGPTSSSNLGSLKKAVRGAVGALRRLDTTSTTSKGEPTTFVLPTSLSTELTGEEVDEAFCLVPSSCGSGDGMQNKKNGVEKEEEKALKMKELVIAREIARWVEESNFEDLSHYGDPQGEQKKPGRSFLSRVNIVPAREASARKNSTKQKSDSLSIVVDPAVDSAVQHGSAVGHATNVAKWLGNVRPDVGSPEFYATLAKEFAASTKGLVKVRHHIIGRELEKRGHHLHWNVGKGSEFPPHLIVLEYTGAPKTQENSVALVGKGVTFDTGGLHVKKYGFMETMHMDMCGAGCVLSTMMAISKMKLETNVVAILGLAENAIGKDAYRPSTVLKSLKGSTVEILNTDAEGRLVLADCLTFIQDHATKVKKKPDTIIDVATLTGAVKQALGQERAGLFSNSHALRTELYKAGQKAQEPVWPLPIAPEHKRAIVGDISDLQNVKKGATAGASNAAAFLQHFINKKKSATTTNGSGDSSSSSPISPQWAHLDIAGVSSGPFGVNGAQKGGATGFGVALLTEYLAGRARK